MAENSRRRRRSSPMPRWTGSGRRRWPNWPAAACCGQGGYGKRCGRCAGRNSCRPRGVVTTPTPTQRSRCRCRCPGAWRRSPARTVTRCFMRPSVGDGALGHPALAPYDRICITAACQEPPAPLLEQLRTGGRLIAPVQRNARQVLRAIEKQPDGLHRTSLCDVLYVSLLRPVPARTCRCGRRLPAAAPVLQGARARDRPPATHRPLRVLLVPDERLEPPRRKRRPAAAPLPNLCPVDLRKLQYAIGFDVAARYQRLHALAEDADFTDEAR